MRFLIFILLLLPVTHALGLDSIFILSEEKRDSLLREAEVASGQSLVDVWNQLGLYYNIADPTKSLDYIKKAKELAAELNYQAGLAFALKEEGMMAFNSGDIIRSLQLLGEARETSEAIEDPALTGRALHCLGLVYSAIGFYEYSLRYYDEAIDQYYLSGNHRAILYGLYDEAEVYVRSRQYAKALEKVKACEEFEKTHQVTVDTGTPYLLKGEIYSGLGNEELALENYRKGQQLIEQEGLASRIRIKSLNVIGRFYLEKGLYKEALESFEEAKRLIEMGNDEVSKGDILYQLALVSLEQGQLKSGSVLVNTALEQAERMGSLPLISDLLFTRAGIYKKWGNDSAALTDMIRAYTLQDSLYSAGYKTYIADMVASLESDKAEKAISNLNDELEVTQGQLENVNTMSKVYLAAAVFFVLLLVIIFRSQTRLRILTKKLYAVNRQVGEQNQELKKLNEERSDFIKLVAHDMRSPITNILSIAELMRKGEQTDAERKEYIDLVERICHNIDNTISKFLGSNFNNSSKKHSPEFETLDIGKLVLSVFDEYKPKAASKNISLECHVPGSRQNANVDRDYILQITSNLVSNAIKFSPGGSQIKLKLEFGQGQFTILVQDNGPGIDIREQKTLFEKYSTTSNKVTGNEQSTGLGLAITKRLVEAMGGKIELVSEKGKGSLFMVKIPIGSESFVEEPSIAES